MTSIAAEKLAREFFERVWTPPHDLDAIDELMTEDYRITTAGHVVEGREAFKAWVAKMQMTVQGATNEHLELFADAAGNRVVSRWITRGSNGGMFGLPAKGESIEFTGTRYGASKEAGSPNVGSSAQRSSFSRDCEHRVDAICGILWWRKNSSVGVVVRDR